SNNLFTSFFGIHKVWPLTLGLISRKARNSSVSATVYEGSSPLIILENIDAMIFNYLHVNVQRKNPLQTAILCLLKRISCFKYFDYSLLLSRISNFIEPLVTSTSAISPSFFPS